MTFPTELADTQKRKMIPVTTVTKDIDAPIGEVWAIVSAWGSEKLWFPNMMRSSLEGLGVGSVRTLTFKPGDFTVSERLEAVDPLAHTLSYALIRNPDHDRAKYPRGSIVLDDLGGAKTRFTWSCKASWVDENFKAEFVYMITGMYSEAIDCLGKLLAASEER
ncbi:hypothetical protein ARSEF1564_003997 [Beauveria bassiana]